MASAIHDAADASGMAAVYRTRETCSFFPSPKVAANTELSLEIRRSVVSNQLDRFHAGVTIPAP